MGDHAISLFREEVLDHSFNNGYGPIRVAQPISSRVMVACASFFALALISFAIFGQVDKRSVVNGITQPSRGSLAIVAPNGGVLVKQFVSEGTIVRAGDPLFEISTARQNTSGELTSLIGLQLRARKDSIETERRNRREQDSEKAADLDDRLRNLDLQEAEITSEIDLAKRRRALGQKTVDQYTSLQAVRFASPAQLQEKQEQLLDLDSRVSALVRSHMQLQASRMGLETERKELLRRSQIDMLQLDRAEASLRQESVENEGRRSSIIVAPAHGTLAGVTYKPGQGILNGQVLATVVSRAIDDSSNDLEIHLYVPSRTVGFIAAGQTVLLRYQAYPYQKFGLQRGTVVQVGETPFAPGELPSNIAATILGNAQQSATGPANNEALYRITVQPENQYVRAYGKHQLLKPGMSLSADVIQERRHIWEWIINPVRALQGQS